MEGYSEAVGESQLHPPCILSFSKSIGWESQRSLPSDLLHQWVLRRRRGERTQAIEILPEAAIHRRRISHARAHHRTWNNDTNVEGRKTFHWPKPLILRRQGEVVQNAICSFLYNISNSHIPFNIDELIILLIIENHKLPNGRWHISGKKHVCTSILKVWMQLLL